jgi:hypothetical protein
MKTTLLVCSLAALLAACSGPPASARDGGATFTFDAGAPVPTVPGVAIHRGSCGDAGWCFENPALGAAVLQSALSQTLLTNADGTKQGAIEILDLSFTWTTEHESCGNLSGPSITLG